MVWHREASRLLYSYPIIAQIVVRRREAFEVLYLLYSYSSLPRLWSGVEQRLKYYIALQRFEYCNALQRFVYYLSLSWYHSDKVGSRCFSSGIINSGGLILECETGTVAVVAGGWTGVTGAGWRDCSFLISQLGSGLRGG